MEVRSQWSVCIHRQTTLPCWSQVIRIRYKDALQLVPLLLIRQAGRSFRIPQLLSRKDLPFPDARSRGHVMKLCREFLIFLSGRREWSPSCSLGLSLVSATRMRASREKSMSKASRKKRMETGSDSAGQSGATQQISD